MTWMVYAFRRGHAQNYDGRGSAWYTFKREVEDKATADRLALELVELRGWDESTFWPIEEERKDNGNHR